MAGGAIESGSLKPLLAVCTNIQVNHTKKPVKINHGLCSFSRKNQPQPTLSSSLGIGIALAGKNFHPYLANN